MTTKQTTTTKAKKPSGVSQKAVSATQPKKQDPLKRFQGLSALSEMYARSLVDPFDGPTACVPDFPSLPSRKLHVYARGFLETGSAGFGYIMVAPQALVASDVDGIWHSSNMYTGTTAVKTGTGVVAVRSNSDLIDSSFGSTSSTAKFRLVSAGVRVRYAGTELNRGGVAVGYQEPNHRNLETSTFSSVDTAPLSERFRPRERWISVVSCPTLYTDLSYTTSLPSTYIWAYLAFVFQAPIGGSSASYEYEVAANFEINGTAVRGMTPSASDPIGLSVVTTAANLDGMKPYEGGPDSATKQLAKRVTDIGTSTISGWISSGIKKIESDPLGMLASAVGMIF